MPKRAHVVGISIGVLISGVAAGATVITAVQRYVYTRPEARQLEHRVDHAEHSHEEDMREIRARLDAILDKL